MCQQQRSRRLLLYAYVDIDLIGGARHRGGFDIHFRKIGRPFQVFKGKDARVVVNPETGKVISVNPSSGAGAH